MLSDMWSWTDTSLIKVSLECVRKYKNGRKTLESEIGIFNQKRNTKIYDCNCKNYEYIEQIMKSHP